MRPAHALALSLLLAAPAAAQTVATFENDTLTQQPLSATKLVENGANLTPAGGFTSAGVGFNNDYSPAFDSWTGFSYSRVFDVTTPGFGNQYAAYNLAGSAGAAGDGGSANYGVAFAFDPGDAAVTLPAGQRPASVRVTNTTYAALSMRDGDAFAKKFGGASGTDPDFFRLTVTGRSAAGATTGSVDFFLADFRSADTSQDYIVSQWTTLDLSGLASDTTRLEFGFASSDVGPFGINTPTYVAVDSLTLQPVPEPAAVALVAAVGLLLRRGRGRGKRPV